MSELITVEGLIEIQKDQVLEVFCDQKKLKPFIKKIEKEVHVKEVNLETKKGRDDIASRAYKVAKMKGALIKVADAALVDAKKLIKDAGEGKKYLVASLDTLRDTTRQPLNEWEEAEKKKEQERLTAIQEKITGIKAIGTIQPGASNEELSGLIEAVDAIDCSEGFDEFAQEALQARSEVKEFLTATLNDNIQKQLAEQQQAELDAKQAELEEKEQAMKLKAKAQERLNTLMMIPTTMFGKTATEIEKKINAIAKTEIIKEEFGELYDQAKMAVSNVSSQLKMMYDNQIIVEKAQAEERAKVEAIDKLHQEQEQTPEPTAQDALNEAITTNEKPVKERLTERFAETATEHQEPTKRQQLDRQLKFWKVEYGVSDTEFNDLMNIINQHF